MRFAVGLPWWGYVLAFASAIVLGWLSYARAAVALTGRDRAILVGLRSLVLLIIVVCLLRPVTYVQAAGARDSIVAILVDVSRSMRLDDRGAPRIDRARTLASSLQAEIGKDYRTELMTFGESLGRATPEQLSADARRSDLSGALAALAERFRGQRLAGVVVLSDGGDTASQEAGSSRPLGVPVFAIGVGDPSVARDREVINLTAGEPLLSGSSVDLSVSVTSAGFGATPFQVRLTENGRPIETRWGPGFRDYDACVDYIRAKGIKAPEGGVALPLAYTVYERPSYSIVPSNALWRDPARADIAAKLRKNEEDNRRRNLYFPQVLRDARAGHVMSPTTTMLLGWIGRSVLGLPFL